MNIPGALDPCSDFWTLNQPWRSTSYTPGPNDPLQCDRFLDPGWYRFAGGDMPTTCPSSFSCGTQVGSLGRMDLFLALQLPQSEKIFQENNSLNR